AQHAGSGGVVSDAGQYRAVLDELTASGGELSDATRFRLAREAFARTARYDEAINAYLMKVGGPLRLSPTPPSSRLDRARGSIGPADTDAKDSAEEYPAQRALELQREVNLRYGENPHQTAAFYRVVGTPPLGLAAMKQLHGPELGYNNVLDFSAALGLLLEFDAPAAVVIKHTNPCGAAVAASVGAAMERAKASDPVSIYGGIAGVTRTLDRAL